MHQFRYLLAFFYSFVGLTLTAQTIIHLDGKELQQPLFEQIEHAVEVGCPSFDIDRVTSLDFKPFAQRGYYASIKNQSLWFLFTVNNTTSQTLLYVLSIENSYLRQDTSPPFNAMEYRLENQTFEQTMVTRYMIDLTPSQMILQVSGYFTDENGLQQRYTVRDIYQKVDERFSSCPRITR